MFSTQTTTVMMRLSGFNFDKMWVGRSVPLTHFGFKGLEAFIQCLVIVFLMLVTMHRNNQLIPINVSVLVIKYLHLRN